jgi:hypothetical protein
MQAWDFCQDTNDPVKISESLEMLVRSVHSTLIKERRKFNFKYLSADIAFDGYLGNGIIEPLPK